MKYKILYLFLGFLILSLCPIPPYVELNHLVLIEKVEIQCIQQKYHVMIKEIIPKKEDNGIEYEYHTYKEIGDELSFTKKRIEEEKKGYKFYYHGVKRIQTNCDNIEEISKIFQVPKKKIKK